MKRHLILAGLAGLLLAIAAVPASSSTIPLSTGGTAIYTIVSDTNGSPDGTTVYAVSNGQIGPLNWYSNPITDSAGDEGYWIAPAAEQEGSTVSGTEYAPGDPSTVYEVQFNLTSGEFSGAALYMAFTGDDCVSSITLNGTPIFSSNCSGNDGAQWAALQGTINDLTGDFVSGTNTLEFTVPNYDGDGASSSGGPTGLDVAASVTYGEGAAPIPEPGTIALLGTGCLALGFLRRRFAK